MKIKVQVNGEKEEVETNAISVAKLLEVLDVKQPDQVIVQVSGEFVEREEFEKSLVVDGDEIDILYSMGGGSMMPMEMLPLDLPDKGPDFYEGMTEDEKIKVYELVFKWKNVDLPTCLTLMSAEDSSIEAIVDFETTYLATMWENAKIEILKERE